MQAGGWAGWGRQAGGRAGRQAGKAGRQVGRQAGGQVGRQAGKLQAGGQEGRQAGSTCTWYCCSFRFTVSRLSSRYPLIPSSMESRNRSRP